MLDPTTLKIIGATFSFAGTTILAIRVTKILSEISQAIKEHDLNFQVQAERARGNSFAPNMLIVGSGTNVEIAEKSGSKLLILGFLLQIIGVACNAAALFL